MSVEGRTSMRARSGGNVAAAASVGASRKRSGAPGGGSSAQRRGALRRCEHEAPVAEARDVDVVGRRAPARRAQRRLDPPERLAREVRRARLDDQPPARRDHAAAHAVVELLRVELRRRRVVGVGEVGDHDVEALAGVAQPAKRVLVDDLHARILQRAAVERAHPLVVARELGHARVELDVDDAPHAVVAQQLADRQPVAAAEHEHAPVRAGHRGVHERLVVAVLVARGELQVAVEKQPQVVGLALRQHDLLVLRALDEHDPVVEQALARRDLEVVGRRRRDRQGDQDGERQQQPGAAQAREQADGDPRERVQRPDRERRLDLPEQRQQQEREAHARDDGAEVVGGEQVGDRRTRRLRARALQQHEQQRDLAGRRAARSPPRRRASPARRCRGRRRRRTAPSPTARRSARRPPRRRRTPARAGAAAAWPPASRGPSRRRTPPARSTPERPSCRTGTCRAR